MAAEGHGKSRALGIFDERVLRRPSVAKPLDSRGTSVDSVIKALLNQGFFLRAGRGRLSKSPEGSCVEHVFNDVWEDMILRNQVDRFAEAKLDKIGAIRDQLRAICVQWQQVNQGYV
jgi:hypothetical protein